MEHVIENLDLGAKGIWLPLAIGGIGLLIILLMPKRQLNWWSIYITFGVVGYVACVTDLFFVVEHLDVIDLGSKQKDGIGDLITYGVIPPSLAVIYLNYFNPPKKWLHAGLFTIISFLFEWSLTQIGYMKLKGWQNWYSIPVYLFVYSYWLPWHLKLMLKLFARHTEELTRNKPFRYSDIHMAQPALKPSDDETDEDNGK